MNALITGGSRGIGAAAVRRFAAAGGKTVFIYRSDDKAAREVSGAAGAVAIRADVSVSSEAAAAVSDAAVCLGGELGCLVLCAGISEKALVTDTTDAMWERLLAVNLSGAFYTARAAIPYMLRRKAGSIIFVSSVWGDVGASCEAAYSASKAGLHGLTKALAKELAPSGIRVNCVAPGVIDTDMNADLDGDVRAGLAGEIPLGRFGGAVEVAETIFYLASDASSYVTGQIIRADGGFVM